MKKSRHIILIVIIINVSIMCGAGVKAGGINSVLDINRFAIDFLQADSATALTKAADQLRQDSQNDTAIADLSLRIANAMLIQRKYSRLLAFIYELERNDYFGNPQDAAAASRAVQLKFFASVAYQQLGLWDKSAQSLISARQAAETTGNRQNLSLIYNNLSYIYQHQKQFRKAITLLEKSIEIDKELQDELSLAYSYNNLSSAYMGLGEYDKAIESNFMALHIFHSLNDTAMYMLTQRNIATKYIRMGEYSMAKRTIESVIDYFVENGIRQELSLTYQKYAFILWKTGDVARAESFYRKAFAYSDDCDVKYKLALLQDYAGFCSGNWNDKRAYSLLERSRHLSDSINTMQDSIRVDAIAQLYSDERDSHDRLLQELSLARWELKSAVVFSCVAIVVACFAVWVFVARCNRRRRATETVVGEKILELKHYSELEEHRVAFLHNLCDRLLVMQKDFKNNAAVMSQLRQMTSIVMKECDAEAAAPSGTGSYDEHFFATLVKHYPNLTANDLRLCSLLRQGLTTKDIADMQCKQTRSVETARNRLRKKIGLSADKDLCIFLNQLH